MIYYIYIHIYIAYATRQPPKMVPFDWFATSPVTGRYSVTEISNSGYCFLCAWRSSRHADKNK